MEVRHRARRAVGPDPEQLVVDVLRLDRRQSQPFDARLVEETANKASQRQCRAGVRAAEPPLRPAAVVGPDVDPGQDDLAMARAQRASHVRDHRLRGEAPLRPTSLRNDAVGAEERAAVLDLDERARPLDRGPPVGDSLDLDSGKRRETPGHDRTVAIAAVHPATSPSSTSSSRSFDRLSTRRAAGSAAANASRPTWTEQPVTTTSASGFARRARRTAWRDFWSATEVTVQVLTRTRSARAPSSTSPTPRSRRNWAADSISAWLTLQPRLAIAAVRNSGHHSAGFVLMRNPIVPTRAAIA